MNPKWLIFFMTVWIFGTVLGLTLEGLFIGEDEQTIVATLMNSKVLTSTTLLGKISGIFTDLAMWVSLGKILIWDFAFWEGALEIVRWIIFLPISMGILFSILTAWIRGVGGT